MNNEEYPCATVLSLWALKGGLASLTGFSINKLLFGTVPKYAQSLQQFIGSAIIRPPGLKKVVRASTSQRSNAMFKNKMR